MLVSGSTKPLRSWRPGSVKDRIEEFVSRTTEESGPDFVEPSKRIAVFDNDGTLWGEQPLYTQVYFLIERIRTLAEQHPEWAHTEPFASILKGQLEAVLKGGQRGVLELLMATHAGMTSDEFERLVLTWIATARHPTTHRLFTEMVFQPMLELLDYLRENGFKTFVVSGGGIDFIRPWALRVYGVPPEQVVGSCIKTQYESRGGQSVVNRLAQLSFIDDGPQKPAGIQAHIGQRPLAAFGNSDGDLEMLQWTTSCSPSLGLLVHHTDATREWAYDVHTAAGKLDRALAMAEESDWVVVDMQRDWSTIYPRS